MPSWWRKSNSKEVKRKGSKDNIFDALHFSKFKFLSEEKTKFKSSRRTNIPVSSDKDLPPETDSSPSPSSFVSRSESFAERPHGKPLPLPSTLGRAESGGPPNQSSENRSGRMSPHLPPLSPGHISNRLDFGDIDGGPASRSVSSLSSEDSNGPANLHSDNSARYRKCQQSNSTIVGGNCEMHVEQLPNLSKNSEQDSSKPGSPLSNRHHASISTKRRVFNMEAPAHLHVPVNGVLASAPESSMSSPSRSPMRVSATEHSPTCATWISKQYPDAVLFSSGQCSSPGSGQNSGHNSMGGDMIGQPYLQPTKGSPEYSPIPSPRMRSGANSRVQSGAVTPLHPRAVGTCPGSPNNWLEEGKHTGHRLPLPPLSVSNQSTFTLPSNSSSTATSSMMPPRSPNRSDNPASPGSRWKKGKLLGRGTFGHVYAGLNNETGKMCAMKEVTLFSDDPKSKESVKQLAQEIAVLSRLRHNNIVQYLGSESIDDKLYIYLEYVSGGSIHKLLQEYGQFGEAVIRGYTRQILSGLAYLHSKSCVHRDIKGANILVDPSGQVKLADFGMAKHITAHSCPLSFKGSPYWMAPEVIKNSNGYNLAVDIWSLGCTVLEMATSKPPWSQYEGVAAMFKIGNSKELPAIPEYLSEEGKQFVRLCLQRDPASRPTALQLLEHPFVKNAAQYIKLDTTTNFSEGFLSSTNFDQPMIVTQVTHSRNVSVEVDNAARTRGMFTPQTSSEQFQIQKHISLPVSPSASPLIQSNYPNHRNGLRSPSPISSPLARSGASTPLTGAAEAIPFQMNGSVRQAQFVDEGFGNMPRSPNGRYGSGSGTNAFYNECRTDPYSGTPKSQTPPDCPSPLHDQLAVENDILSKAFGRLARGGNFDIQKQCGGQVALAEHVSKQLLKTPSSYPAVNLRPGSPLLDRAATYENC